MRDSWLDNALRSLDGPEPSRDFSVRTLNALRLQRDRRRARIRLGFLATSVLTLGCALILAWLPSSTDPSVTEAEIAGLRAEIHSLRSELPALEFEIDRGASGELWVDMDALLSASANEGDPSESLDALFAIEGGQL
ncbi:MAG: hypothetical protein AAF658_14740 [Myxococcota bacterium]